MSTRQKIQYDENVIKQKGLYVFYENVRDVIEITVVYKLLWKMWKIVTKKKEGTFTSLSLSPPKRKMKFLGYFFEANLVFEGYILTIV